MISLKLHENGITINWDITAEGEVLLLQLSPDNDQPLPAENEVKYSRLVELQESGMGQRLHHYAKQIGTVPGCLLHYRQHRDFRNNFGRKLEVEQEYHGLRVISHIQFFDGISVIKSWTQLVNTESELHPVEYVSSFAFTGLSRGTKLPRDKSAVVYLPHSTWYGEAQWKKYSLNQLGYEVVNDSSVKRIHLSNTGTWACGEFLPMGSYVNTELMQAVTWQIETSASWNWELSDVENQLYLQLSGPSARENMFIRNLKFGESFVSVPCAVAIVKGDFEKSIQELTKYRRVVRRKNEDNEHPKAIFNDYMNCLTGDPTTEKLLPLIDAAAESGCKYFCIDCGWYDDGPWWEGVGQWLPAKGRFPNGIQEPLDYIRKKGMVPGLWLELEVMGVNCPLVSQVSKDWFFQRNGRPVIDEGRYQLDFRNPEVIAHADAVIKRLVEEYKVGYIKMDYNINGGVGTERCADSAGAGLLEHTRAYLSWLDKTFEAYPGLVIENCSSGGMRMEYSMLSRHSIQSVTDQTDYLKMAAIAANCMTAVTPEQAAIWSYPLRDGDCEETIFNMVNAILFRIHQSGHLAEISKERLYYVQEGIRCHHAICEELKIGLPFWPIGLASFSDDFLSVGVNCGKKLYLAVWRIGGEQDTIALPIHFVRGQQVNAFCLYPAGKGCRFSYDEGKLYIELQPKTARIFEIDLE
jgi:alpha-galactosidase